MTVIAIDGPAGSGKSTLARLLADRLGFVYLDTGAMYRAVAYLALRDGIALSDAAALTAVAQAAELTFNDEGHMVAAGVDVSDEIRRPAVSAAVSEVSAHAAVRALLVAVQRQLAAGRNVVMEGRDIGTVVFPDAAVKVFLTAQPQVRAERRHQELLAKGVQTSPDETLAALMARDEYDSSRSVSPLFKASDAIEVDTSNLDVSQVLDRLESVVRAALTAAAQRS
jgi:cytidylate kinase